MTRHLFSACVATIIAAGCGGGISAPSTTPVRGQVLFKSKPAAGVRVTFHPQFNMGSVKFTPSAETGNDGRFALSTAAAGDGAPPGEYAVTLALPRVESDRKTGLEVEVDLWRGKYDDPAAGRWKVHVRKGEAEIDPFRID